MSDQSDIEAMIHFIAIREAPIGMKLVMLEGNEIEELILDATQPLLKEFKDILTNNLSIKLPPLKKIQHDMDLIPKINVPQLTTILNVIN